MKISEELRKRAGKKYFSTNWWTNNLMNELMASQKKDINQFDTNFVIPGDLIFFMYSAKYPQKYKFWDLHPLVYVIEVRPREGLFFGSNVHYLNPGYRGGVTTSYLNKQGNVDAPRKTLKNYLFTNVMSDLFKVPRDDWEGVSLLPTEQFVGPNGRTVPKYRVWAYPDSLSSP